MNLSIRILGLALLLGGALSCGDDHDDGDEHDDEHLEGLQKCCWLGEICHEADDPTHPEAGACHDVGHENDPDKCLEQFDSCRMQCDPDKKTTLPDSCEDPSGDPHGEEG